MSSPLDSEALVYKTRYASGEFNDDLLVEATEDGLELDLGVVIPWTWILRAMKARNIKAQACPAKFSERYANWEEERAAIVEAIMTLPKREGEMIPYALGDRIRWIIARLVKAEEKE